MCSTIRPRCASTSAFRWASSPSTSRRCARWRAPDFPPNVPQSARDGTRTNLLSEALLDGANYPSIRLRATDVAAAGEGYDVGVEITIKDQVRNVRVPVTFERKDGALKASGEFPLKQSDLGFKPFSVAMGTLVVIDEMRIHFEVSARQ